MSTGITCPACGFANIAGADTCEQCGQSLGELSHPRPSTPIEQRILEDRINVLDPQEPVMVPPDTPVSQVLSIMVEKHIGCLLIGRDSKVEGIFSERDALNRVGSRASELGDRPISGFMTPSPETLDVTDKVAFALHKMDLGGYRHIPVTRGKTVAGIISIRDILTYISQNLFETEQV